MAGIDHALLGLRRDGSHLLQPRQIDQLASALGQEFRARTLTPGRTLQLFVQQVAHGNVACTAVRHLAGEDFTDSAWCQARARLSLTLIAQVLEEVTHAARRDLEMTGDVGDGSYRWHGHRLYVVDGTNDSMPDTPELRKHYGVPSGCREGLGFPTSHLLLTMDHASGLLVNAVDAPLHTSDLSQTPQAHQHLSPGDILLGDEIFSGWGYLALILQARLHSVTPVQHRRIVDFTAGRAHAHPRYGKAIHKAAKPRSRLLRVLGPEDQIVEYFKPAQQPAWISPAQWAALPESITVREIRRTIQRHGFRPLSVTIVTTLLDPVAYPADELIELRLTRWMIETNIRHLKITLGMDVLKCQTLAGVRKERLVFLLVYNLIRMLMLQMARGQRVHVNRLSFADALAWLRLGDLGCPPRLKVNPLRPGRLEPRAIKRQKKEFPYMTVSRAQLKSQLQATYGNRT
jgi:hypothetical protein